MPVGGVEFHASKQNSLAQLRGVSGESLWGCGMCVRVCVHVCVQICIHTCLYSFPKKNHSWTVGNAVKAGTAYSKRRKQGLV